MRKSQKEMVIASLEKFGSVELTVGGWSMWPFIRNGNTIRIKRKTGYLFPGMVGVIFNGDQLIAHRIIWKRHSGTGVSYWISGDSMGLNFSLVHDNEVIGCVKRIGRKWNLQNLWLFYPLCLFSPIIGFFLAFILKRSEFIKSKLPNRRK